MSALLLGEKFSKEAQTLALKLDILCKCLSELLLKADESIEQLASLRNDSDIVKTHADKDSLLELKEQTNKMKICLCTLLNRTLKFLNYAEKDKNGIRKLERALASGDVGPFNNYVEQLKRYLTQSDECHEDYKVYYNQAEAIMSEYVTAHEGEGKKEGTVGAAAVGTAIGVSTGALLYCLLPIPTPATFCGAAVAGLCAGRAYKGRYNTEEQPSEGSEDKAGTLLHTLQTMGRLSQDLQTAQNDFRDILTYIIDPTAEREHQVEKLLAEVVTASDLNDASTARKKQCVSQDEAATPTQFSSSFSDFIANVKDAHQCLEMLVEYL